MPCTCEDWVTNIPKIDGPIVLQQIRNPDAPRPDIKPFQYCPWCAKALTEESPTVEPQPVPDNLSVENRIKELLIKGLEQDPKTAELTGPIFDELDEPDLVFLVMDLEETFKTEITDEDMEKIHTLQDLLDYAKAHNWK